jgi:hypothetical protein
MRKWSTGVWFRERILEPIKKLALKEFHLCDVRFQYTPNCFDFSFAIASPLIFRRLLLGENRSAYRHQSTDDCADNRANKTSRRLMRVEYPEEEML